MAEYKIPIVGSTLTANKLVGTDANKALTPVSVGTGLSLSSGTLSATGGGGASEFILLRDVKSNNTGGGTFTAGAWQTRVLNEETIDDGDNCTLASNEFTLAAGTYDLWASCPANNVVEHKARLYNVTDSTVVAIGQNARAAYFVTTNSIVVTRFTITTSKKFRIEHRCSTTTSTYGFGYPNNFGCDEVYTVVAIWKVA